jgi:hypothetical protein
MHLFTTSAPRSPCFVRASLASKQNSTSESSLVNFITPIRNGNKQATGSGPHQGGSVGKAAGRRRERKRAVGALSSLREGQVLEEPGPNLSASRTKRFSEGGIVASDLKNDYLGVVSEFPARLRGHLGIFEKEWTKHNCPGVRVRARLRLNLDSGLARERRLGRQLHCAHH